MVAVEEHAMPDSQKKQTEKNQPLPEDEEMPEKALPPTKEISGVRRPEKGIKPLTP